MAVNRMAEVCEFLVYLSDETLARVEAAASQEIERPGATAEEIENGRVVVDAVRRVYDGREPARHVEHAPHVGETGIECPFCDRELDWNGHLHVFCCDCCDYKWKDAAEIERDRKLVAMAYSQMTGGLDG